MLLLDKKIQINNKKGLFLRKHIINENIEIYRKMKIVAKRAFKSHGVEYT